MEILLNRLDRKDYYTGGKLFINGLYECDTVEDADRDLNKNGIFDCGETKVMHETAIPNGRYEITLEYSPKFSPKINNSNLPKLHDVPEFKNILIHWGNTAADSSGCILVGNSYSNGTIYNSKKTFLTLLGKIKNSISKGEKVFITIK